jgi:hypothetical protein
MSTESLYIENAHPWMKTNIFKNLEKQEIARRVCSIKERLIGEVLSSSGNPIALNGIFNYLSVLVQLPMLVLLYEKTEDSYILKEHFDFEKTKSSRGSLALQVYDEAAALYVDFEPKANKPVDLDYELIQIYQTDYFVRVFLLKIGGEDNAPFFEMPIKPLQTKEHYDVYEMQREYARLCLIGALTFDTPSDKTLYGTAFLSELNSKIVSIFKSHDYETQTKEDRENRRQKTLVNENINEDIQKFVKARNSDITGKLHSLDRLYRRASYASRTLKRIGKSTGTDDNSSTVDIPNLIFFLRTYDRSTPRAQRVIEDEKGKVFRGYAHNVSVVLPYQQEEDLKERFQVLQNVSNSSDVAYRGERYANNWEFTNADYKTFAQSLDQEFWKEVKTPEGVQKLLDILKSPMGSHTTSMADAVFYYGTSMYRIPFRRDGGLSRIFELPEIYRNLNLEDRNNFVFELLPNEAESMVRHDCLRVVTLFYVSRMLARSCSDQHLYWTKAHLYPIDVAGTVVGAIGNFSYELKIPTTENGDTPLPIDTATWNQEFYFFVEIFGAIQRALRQQFRDFQINRLGEELSSSLSDLISDASRNNYMVGLPDMEKFVERLNTESRRIARVCPYPAYEFNLIESTKYRQKDMDENTVPLGTALALQFERKKDWDIFRPLFGAKELPSGSDFGGNILPGIDFVFKENAQSLVTKLHERAKMTLETAAKLQAVESRSGETQ